jgi:hypothetical protein
MVSLLMLQLVLVNAAQGFPVIFVRTTIAHSHQCQTFQFVHLYHVMALHSSMETAHSNVFVEVQLLVDRLARHILLSIQFL